MLESCLAALANQNIRETKTRRVLLSILHSATEPLAPPELVSRCHQAGRKANKTTIYRDLAAMEVAGIVRRVSVSDRKQYFELAETGHHHHFICLGCNKVEDVLLNESDFLRQGESSAKQIGFSILQHSLEFFGRCKLCA